MSDIALATQPSQPLAPKQTRNHAPKVTGKVRIALDAMVWEGLPRKAAAEKAGISEHGLYKAFRKPVVKAFYLSELEVLRTSERARSIHRIAEIRDAADNMPALKAAEYFATDKAEMPGRSTGSLQLPGLTIQILMTSPDAPVNASLTRHDAKPLIEHEDGSHDRDD